MASAASSQGEGVIVSRDGTGGKVIVGRAARRAAKRKLAVAAPCVPSAPLVELRREEDANEARPARLRRAARRTQRRSLFVLRIDPILLDQLRVIQHQM